MGDEEARRENEAVTQWVDWNAVNTLYEDDQPPDPREGWFTAKEFQHERGITYDQARCWLNKQVDLGNMLALVRRKKKFYRLKEKAYDV